MSVVRAESGDAMVVIDEGWRDDAPLPEGVCGLIADEHAPPALRSSAAASGMLMMEPMFTARACLAVAERQVREGALCDAVSLQVRYPREPEAVLNWRARYPNRAADSTDKVG